MSGVVSKDQKKFARSPSNGEAQPIATGGAVGRLEIPRLGISVMVLEGVDAGTLLRGVGHIPGTSLPGPAGNVGLAGHRDTFFRPLKDIRTGDEILLTTTERTYAYRVRASEVVEPRDTWVLAATEDPTLTLVTCYPFSYLGPAPKRFVVQARRAFESSGSARTSGRSTSALPLETVSTTKDQAGPQVRQPVVERLAHLDR